MESLYAVTSGKLYSSLNRNVRVQSAGQNVTGVAPNNYTIYTNINRSLERSVGLPQTAYLNKVNTVLGNDSLIKCATRKEATLIELFSVEDACRRRTGEDLLGE
jgi:hypothetical protein